MIFYNLTSVTAHSTVRVEAPRTLTSYRRISWEGSTSTKGVVNNSLQNYDLYIFILTSRFMLELRLTWTAKKEQMKTKSYGNIEVGMQL